MSEKNNEIDKNNKYTFYSPQELSKDKKKNVNLLMFTAIFLFLVSAGIGLLYFYEQNKSQKEKEKLEQEMKEMNTMLDNIKEERQKLEEENVLQSEELDNLKRKLVDKEKRIRKLIRIGRKYEEAKTEIEELRTLNVEYLTKVDSLLKENKLLKNEVSTLRGSLTSAINQNRALVDELDKEQERPKIKDDLSKLNFSVSGFKTEPLRSLEVGNIRVAKKAKKTRLIRTCLTLTETSKNGKVNKINMVVRYTGPNGKVLNPKPESPLIEVKGLEKAVSLKRTMSFKNNKNICLNFEPSSSFKFQQGIYVSEVFLTVDNKDYYMLASDRFSLK